MKDKKKPQYKCEYCGHGRYKPCRCIKKLTKGSRKYNRLNKRKEDNDQTKSD